MGCFVYPNICYGWIEPNDQEIDVDTLEQICEIYDIDFRSFAGETNHGLKCSTVYGALCNFNDKTCQVSITDDDKNKVEKIYNVWKLKNNINVDCDIKFHIIMSGDIDSYNSQYYGFDISN